MILEKTYSKKVGLSHRKKYAQFFTPEEIAVLMIDWVLQNENLQKVLEPAFGLGVFSRLLLNQKPDL
jgi:adenine-specific DNA-methyltransferase